jgi:hypothetical protein
MIWLFDLLIEFYFITSLFDFSCMNDSTSNRICLFETIHIVDFSSICWFRIESFYNHSIEMIFFTSINFRDRRKVNEFEDEYAILMKSNRNDNERRRWLNQKKKFFVTNEDLDSQMNLDESEDEKSVNKWMKKIFYIIS